jgi:hypothetical protein
MLGVGFVDQMLNVRVRALKLNRKNSRAITSSQKFPGDNYFLL